LTLSQDSRPNNYDHIKEPPTMSPELVFDKSQRKNFQNCISTKLETVLYIYIYTWWKGNFEDCSDTAITFHKFHPANHMRQ